MIRNQEKRIHKVKDQEKMLLKWDLTRLSFQKDDAPSIVMLLIISALCTFFFLCENLIKGTLSLKKKKIIRITKLTVTNVSMESPKLENMPL